MSTKVILFFNISVLTRFYLIIANLMAIILECIFIVIQTRNPNREIIIIRVRDTLF